MIGPQRATFLIMHTGSAASSCGGGGGAAALAASSKSNKNVTRAAYETMSRSFCCLRETELRMSRVATSMSNDSSGGRSSVSRQRRRVVRGF